MIRMKRDLITTVLGPFILAVAALWAFPSVGTAQMYQYLQEERIRQTCQRQEALALQQQERIRQQQERQQFLVLQQQERARLQQEYQQLLQLQRAERLRQLNERQMLRTCQ